MIIEYRYIGKDDIYLLDKPDGKQILNKKASDYFGKPYYYQVSSRDPLRIINYMGEWVHVEHKIYSENNGWILKAHISEYKNGIDKGDILTNTNRNSNESTTNIGKYKTSRGYASDLNYKPTVDDRGSYHTIDGKRKQIQYQGSKEQQEHLDAIKKYMEK